MKKDSKFEIISTKEGAFEVLKPFLEKVSYVEVTSDKSIKDLKMDSLDTLEVMNNIEKAYCESTETVFGEEWQKLTTVQDLLDKMVEFGKTKMAQQERIEIASEKVRGEIERSLSRFKRQPVTISINKIKDLGIPARRLKIWAEKHFGFSFSKEEREKKVETLQDLYCLVIAHYDEMKI